MADIFISYAREDRDLVAKLAAALEGAGYPLWWDRHIATGAEFSADIEREIKAAKAVIVAWSQAAASSHWVKDEATYARDTGKLVPVSLDGTEPPMGFRQFQASDLTNWKGAANAVEFIRLRDSIAQKVDATAPSPTAVAAVPVPKTERAARRTLLIAAGALAFAGLVAGAILAFAPWRQAAPLPAISGVVPRTEEASIAVLAFANMSGDKDNEYFSDGIAEELLNDLAQIPGLRVAARTSSFSFKGKTASIADIAKALNVRAVLEGSVRRAGTRVRITAQLINAADGFHMWSETYDREIADIFAVQDEIAKAITRELTGRLLTASDAGEAEKPKINPDAYTAYLQGRFFLAKRNKPEMLRAVDFFKQALALEPDYADAHASLGYTYARLYSNGQRFDVLPAAREEAAAALKLDPDNIQALVTKAIIAWSSWNWLEAAAVLRAAMKLNPNDAEVPFAYGELLASLDLQEAAVAAERQAVALDPLSPIMRFDLGSYLYLLNRNTESIAEYQAALTLDPNLVFALRNLCEELAVLGRFDEAKKILSTRLAAVDGEDGPQTSRCRLMIAARSGDAPELKRLTALAVRHHAQGDLTVAGVAWTFAQAGDVDQAITWYDKAYDERARRLFSQIPDPAFPAKLKADPRWKAFMQRPLIKEWQAARARVAAELAAEAMTGGSGPN